MPYSPDNPPDLVIFDNDGVLIDSEHLAGVANAQVLGEYGIDISADEAVERFIGLGPKNMQAEFAKLGIPLTKEYEYKVWHVLRDRIHSELKAIDGVIDLIRAIKAANIPVCVCSNAPEQWLTTSHRIVGLDAVLSAPHYFHRDLVEHPKPAPDLHLLALDSFGVAANRALVIEDSSVGAMGAVAAGIPVFGFTGASGVPKTRSEQLMDVGCQQTLATMVDVGKLLLGTAYQGK